MSEEKKKTNIGLMPLIVVAIIIGAIYHYSGCGSENKSSSQTTETVSKSLNVAVELSANGDISITNNDNFTYPITCIDLNNGYLYNYQIPISAGKRISFNLGICVGQVSGSHFNPDEEKISHIEITAANKVPYDNDDILGTKEFNYNQ
jgi:hypothetical protein